MGMLAETGVRRDTIIIDHAQRVKSPLPRVVIIIKREAMPTLQSIGNGLAVLGGIA